MVPGQWRLALLAFIAAVTVTGTLLGASAKGLYITGVASIPQILALPFSYVAQLEKQFR